MTILISKLLIYNFILKKKTLTKKQVRARYGTLSGIVGIICNVMLCVLKFIIGLASASISIIADAANNLSDAASSIVTLVGFKLASRPANSKHPFGMGRIEYISGLIVSMVITIMGFEFVKSSIEGIISPEPVSLNTLSLIILSASALVKLWMYFFNMKLAKATHSETMRATALDSLCDVLITVTVAVGMIVTKFAGVNIDGWIGVCVALFIMYTGITTAKDTLSPLLGQSPDKKFVKEIENKVLSYDKILGVHDVLVHNYGPMFSTLSLDVEVESDANLVEIHNVIDKIEYDIKEEYGYDVVIHVDPVISKDNEVNFIKSKIEEHVKIVNEDIILRDFRINNEDNKTFLLFEAIIPYEFHLSDTVARNTLTDVVKNLYPNFNVRIRVRRHG